MPRHAWYKLALVPILFGVWLVSMAAWLWQRDHYQFFPLVLVAVAALSYYRLQGVEWNARLVLTPKTLFLGSVSLALAALAVVSSSQWVGTVAAMTFTWMLIWLIGGRPVADQLRGPFFLLLLIVPIPLDLDLWLIIELQKIATTAASGLLDWFGIVHLTQGVALTTVNREFMVEEACSGIHSLFSCLTVMMFWAVYHRYGLIRVVLTFLHTVVWVVAANSLRVFLVVYADTRYGVSLDTGWRHEMLGIFTYFLALGLALSMDQWLKFLIAMPEITEISTSVKRLGWKRLSNLVNYPLLSERTSLLVSKIALAGLFLPLSLAALFALVGSYWSSGANGDGQAFVASLDSKVISTALPKAVDEFELMNVREVDRSAGDVLGSNSVIATYAGNGMTVQFSVDGFYDAWHDLAICYTAMDWNVNDAANESQPQAGDDGGKTRLELYRDGGERAFCLFSCYDSKGDFVEPNASSGSPLRKLVDRLKSGHVFGGQSGQSIAAPVHQYQLFVSGDRELLLHEREMLEKLFGSLREACRDALAGERGKGFEPVGQASQPDGQRTQSEILVFFDTGQILVGGVI